MKFMRNPEVKPIVFISAFIIIVFTAISFIVSVTSGFLVLISCFILLCIFLAAEKKRYAKIEKLTDTIDKVLHGNDEIEISDNVEGELSVLQSEIQKMLIRLREQNEELKKERLFLSDSIADISHQLRTPLTSINLVLSLLSQPDLADERRLELTSELSKLLHKTDYLVTALLKLSKLDAGTVIFEKRCISIKELVNKAAEPLLIAMELKQQALITHIEDETVCGDFLWLCEAVSNIIKNCFEHTQSGGTVTISANSIPLYTEIVISDNGPGIDNSDLPHIFDRFYKGKNSSKSSYGIGLALAKSIITGHGGILKAANGKNGGAVFTIRFYKTVI